MGEVEHGKPGLVKQGILRIKGCPGAGVKNDRRRMPIKGDGFPFEDKPKNGVHIRIRIHEKLLYGTHATLAFCFYFSRVMNGIEGQSPGPYIFI